MNQLFARRRFVLAALFILSTEQLFAQVVLPVGTFQEIFVTNDSTSATSNDISTYNNFVTAEAALSTGLPSGVSWTAVASTAPEPANLNATSGSYPVYNTAGQIVSIANSIYSGSVAHPVDYNQFGISVGSVDTSPPVWTGSNADGTGATGNTLGSTSTSISVGNPAVTGGTWLSGNFATNGPEISHPLYALSSPMTSVLGGGGTTVVGGVQVTVPGTSTTAFTSNFLSTTDPTAASSFIGSAAFGAINFALPFPPDPIHPVYQAWDMSFLNPQPLPPGYAVTIHFDPTTIMPSEISKLSVMHYTGGQWQEPPDPCIVNPTANTITFQTNSFSPFMLAVVPEPSTWALLVTGALSLTAAAMRSRRRRTA